MATNPFAQAAAGAAPNQDGEENIGDLSSGISLAELAGLPTEDIAPFRFGEKLPVGSYGFRITNETGLTEINSKPCATIHCEVMHVFSLADSNLNAEDYIGKQHVELLFIKTDTQEALAQGLGKVVAFAEDVGLTKGAPVGQLLADMADRLITGHIKHTPKAGDTDVVYANLVNVQPVPDQQ